MSQTHKIQTPLNEKLKIREMTHEMSWCVCATHAPTVPRAQAGELQPSAQRGDKAGRRSWWWDEETVKRNSSERKQAEVLHPSIHLYFLQVSLSGSVMSEASAEGKGKIKQCQQRRITCTQISERVTFWEDWRQKATRLICRSLITWRPDKERGLRLHIRHKCFLC